MLNLASIVMTYWDNIIDPIMSLINDLIGNPILIGVIVFLFLTIFGLLMYIPIEAMIVIWIPASFLIAIYIPQIQIIVGIMLGILIGIGILKWVRR